jgi:hypothetical protein
MMPLNSAQAIPKYPKPPRVNIGPAGILKDDIMSKSKKPVIPAPLTSAKIRHLAGEGLERPSALSAKEVRSLSASVMAHIEPRGNNQKKPK